MFSMSHSEPTYGGHELKSTVSENRKSPLSYPVEKTDTLPGTRVGSMIRQELNKYQQTSNLLMNDQKNGSFLSSSSQNTNSNASLSISSMPNEAKAGLVKTASVDSNGNERGFPIYSHDTKQKTMIQFLPDIEKVSQCNMQGQQLPSIGSQSMHSHFKQIRQKWKLSEDSALMIVLLTNAHLLTYTEYYKPMKNFWIKISQILKQEFGYKRNMRQCHDRFKVLYAKSYKNYVDTNPNENISENVKEFRFLLKQLEATFGFSNGAVNLRDSNNLKLSFNRDPISGKIYAQSISTGATDSPVLASSQAPQLENAIPLSSIDRDRQEITEAQKQYVDSVCQSIHNVVSSLQNQVELLKSQIDTWEKKTFREAAQQASPISEMTHTVPPKISESTNSTLTIEPHLPPKSLPAANAKPNFYLAPIYSRNSSSSTFAGSTSPTYFSNHRMLSNAQQSAEKQAHN